MYPIAKSMVYLDTIASRYCVIIITNWFHKFTICNHMWNLYAADMRMHVEDSPCKHISIIVPNHWLLRGSHQWVWFGWNVASLIVVSSVQISFQLKTANFVKVIRDSQWESMVIEIIAAEVRPHGVLLHTLNSTDVVIFHHKTGRKRILYH